MDTGGEEASMDNPSSSTTITTSETLISPSDPANSTNSNNVAQSEESPPTESSINQADLLKAVEVAERDSFAIAQSFASLFDSLRLALSTSTSSTIDHMQCFSDASGRIQESAIEASTRGSRFVNSCLRLNQEMKGVDALAMQLKILRRNVDALDVAVNRLLRIN